jgi:hypothetical protein
MIKEIVQEIIFEDKKRHLDEIEKNFLLKSEEIKNRIISSKI